MKSLHLNADELDLNFDQCPIPGWQDYASNRGGSLMVNFGQGRFVFCYRPIDV